MVDSKLGIPKRPRLFYYEEAVDGWIPAPDKIGYMIDTDHFSEDKEKITIEFKRIDMTDKEFNNLPGA